MSGTTHHVRDAGYHHPAHPLSVAPRLPISPVGANRQRWWHHQFQYRSVITVMIDLSTAGCPQASAASLFPPGERLVHILNDMRP